MTQPPFFPEHQQGSDTVLQSSLDRQRIWTEHTDSISYSPYSQGLPTSSSIAYMSQSSPALTHIWQQDPIHGEGHYRVTAVAYDPRHVDPYIEQPQQSSWTRSQDCEYVPSPVHDVGFQLSVHDYTQPLYPPMDARTMQRSFSDITMGTESSYGSSPMSPLSPVSPNGPNYWYTARLTSSTIPGRTTADENSSIEFRPEMANVARRPIPRPSIRQNRSSPSSSPSAEKSYRCQNCDAFFASRGARDTHVRAHNNATKMLAVCVHPGCEKKFGRQADATRHWKSVHRGDKFPCSKCGNEYPRSDIAIRHFNNCRRRTRSTPRRSV